MRYSNSLLTTTTKLFMDLAIELRKEEVGAKRK
jgi:hypothetical protein